METVRELVDRGRTLGMFRLEKFHVSRRGIVDRKPHEILKFPNLLANAGGALMEDLLMGAGGTVFNNANSYIGVGDSTTAVSAAHTDLQAATNKLRKAMVATYPSRSGQIITWQSLFASGDANWAWNEMAVFNASSVGTMFARALVSSPFTKTSALAITASYTWTVS
jgi:hypothetical protein